MSKKNSFEFLPASNEIRHYVQNILNYPILLS